MAKTKQSHADQSRRVDRANDLAQKRDTSLLYGRNQDTRQVYGRKQDTSPLYGRKQETRAIQWSLPAEGRVLDMSSVSSISDSVVGGGSSSVSRSSIGRSVWVRTEQCVCKYNSMTGECISRLRVPLTSTWGGLCVDDSRAYTVVADRGSLLCVDGTGECVRRLCVPGAGLLGGVVYCHHTDMYVAADTQARCLWYVNACTGGVAWKVTCGSSSSQSLGPGYLYHHACADGQCHIYVSDQHNHCVLVYTSDGDYVKRFGGVGGGRKQLNYPCGLCVDGGGRVVVCDMGNRRVVRYWWERECERWSVVLTREQLNGDKPMSIDITPDGAMLVGTEGQNGYRLTSYAYDS